MDNEQDVKARLGRIERQLAHVKTLLILLLVLVAVRSWPLVSRYVNLGLRGLLIIIPVLALGYAGLLLLERAFLRRAREKRDQDMSATMQEEIDACRSAHAGPAGSGSPSE
jgi:hypothetical protein